MGAAGPVGAPFLQPYPYPPYILKGVPLQKQIIAPIFLNRRVGNAAEQP